MNDQDNHAALILAYSRVESVRTIIGTLSNSNISRIYLAVDGHANENIAREFKDMVADILAHDSIRVTYWQREENWGTAGAIISAIDWFFANENSGLIIEDDLEFDADFIEFISVNLEKYENQKEIWLISGTQLFSELSPHNEFSTYPQIWGWGTWKDRWVSIKPLILEKEYSPKKMPTKVKIFWLLSLLRSRTREVDSWAMAFAAQMHAQEGICVMPPRNLITNNGFDSHAIHTTKKKWPLALERYPWQATTHMHEKCLVCIYNVDRAMEERVFRIGNRHILSLLVIFARIVMKNRSRNELRDYLNTAPKGPKQDRDD